VAIFKDNNPWASATNEMVLNNLGITYDVYTSADIGVVDISGYDKVMIASDQTTAFYTAVEANLAYFENYVAAGGVLHLHAADGGWSGGYWPTGALPCGFQYSHYYGNIVDVLIPNHPILNTPNVITDPELDYWGYSYHGGIISGFPEDSQIVLQDSAVNNPVLVISDFGSGSVIVCSMTIEWATKNEITYLLENTISYHEGTFQGGSSVSPIAIYMPVVKTNLAKANGYWECINEKLPDEVTQDVSALIDQVGTYMNDALTLSNPIATSGKLIKAIELMAQLDDELDLGCISSSA